MSQSSHPWTPLFFVFSLTACVDLDAMVHGGIPCTETTAET